MKELLITSGFPRSGNTYLNHALNLLYYPEQKVNSAKFTVAAIEKTNQIIVTFRNPSNAIASWHNYPSEGNLESDVQYYIRFYSFVLNNLNKVVLMDFDYFTKNINYIKNKVLKNFGIKTNCILTDFQVKETMLANGLDKYLPTQNQTQLLETKTLLPKLPNFEKCFLIYDKLQQAAI